MSELTSTPEKPLVWIHGEIKSPPFSREARLEAGHLLGRLQRGEALSMPVSRPMPVIAPRCHELRVVDGDRHWRVIYRANADAIVVLEVFAKKTRATPQAVIERCRRRLILYERSGGER